MKLLKKLLAVLVAGTISVLIIQWIIKKLHQRWSGSHYIALFDDNETHYSPHPHLAAVERRFRG